MPGLLVFLILLPIFSYANICSEVLANSQNTLILPENFGSSSAQKLSKQEIDFLKDTIFKKRSVIDFYQIDPSEFKNLVEMKTNGKGNLSIHTGIFRGQKVVIKISNPQMRPESQVINEAKWLMFLGQLGIGPKFFGIYRNKEGFLVLVMEFIEGQSINMSTQDFSQVNVNTTTLKRIEEIAEILRDLGVKYAPDIQFMVTPSGQLKMIDPEYFSWEIPRTFLLDPNQMPYNIWSNCKQIYQNIQSYLMKKPKEQPKPGGDSNDGIIIISK